MVKARKTKIIKSDKIQAMMETKLGELIGSGSTLSTGTKYILVKEDQELTLVQSTFYAKMISNRHLSEVHSTEESAFVTYER